jgi:hypothetical protein
MNRAKCRNEYYNQQGVSMFERVLKSDNVQLFRLKINYRMYDRSSGYLEPHEGYPHLRQSTFLDFGNMD